jgi:hypothetical protein
VKPALNPGAAVKISPPAWPLFFAEFEGKKEVLLGSSRRIGLGAAAKVIGSSVSIFASCTTSRCTTYGESWSSTLIFGGSVMASSVGK